MIENEGKSLTIKADGTIIGLNSSFNLFEIESKIAQFERIEARFNELYYAPGMPGYISAREEFNEVVIHVFFGQLIYL